MLSSVEKGKVEGSGINPVLKTIPKRLRSDDSQKSAVDMVRKRRQASHHIRCGYPDPKYWHHRRGKGLGHNGIRPGSGGYFQGTPDVYLG